MYYVVCWSLLNRLNQTTSLDSENENLIINTLIPAVFVKAEPINIHLSIFLKHEHHYK